MTPRLRLLLSAALGFATGILAATACAAPEPRPVELRGGVMTGPPGRALRPISLRVGGDQRRVGEDAPAGADQAVVYLDVSGVAVQAVFAVMPPGE